MKKIKTILKSNLILIIGIIIGLLLCTSVYAATIYYNGIEVAYDNTNSGLASTDVQGALDELYGYTISFNANGGSGGQSSSIIGRRGCSMPNSIDRTIPTRSGYKFMGWYDNSNYTQGTQYYDNSVQAARTFDKSGNTTLYAGWNNNLELGDYFTLAPDEATATTTIEGFSGSTPTTDQTLWRVIDVHQDGTIDAVSEYVSTNTITISGTNGYKNYIAGLQDIASKYAKTGYTTATRMMGYDGQTLTISDTSSFDGTLNPTDNPDVSPPSTQSTPTTGTGQEYSGGVLGDTLYLKDYQLVGNVYKTDTATYGTTGLMAYNKAGNARAYWLASRYYIYTNATRFYFYGRDMSSSGNSSNYNFRYYNSGWYDGEYGYSVRPIITIRSGLIPTAGSGSKDNPFEFE